MTEPTVALEEYLRNVGLEVDRDFLRQGRALLTRMLIEMEVKRRTKVVGILPDTDSVFRLEGSVPMEAHDE